MTPGGARRVRRLVMTSGGAAWEGLPALGGLRPLGERPVVVQRPGPRRRQAPTAGPSVASLLDLVGAACGTGASIPRALEVVGGAIGGLHGAALAGASQMLVLGARWDEAWDRAPSELAPVHAGLRAAWEEGVAPTGVLRTAAVELRRDEHRAALEAAGRLGVRLVLPLGLCYLPAFVLVGLVPVLVSMTAGLIAG